MADGDGAVAGILFGVGGAVPPCPNCPELGGWPGLAGWFRGDASGRPFLSFPSFCDPLAGEGGGIMFVGLFWFILLFATAPPLLN